MDDLKLAEQWAKTGNFMDLCLDEEWVKESARIEDEFEGCIEAGLGMRDYAAAKYDPALAHVRQNLRQKMRVQSILFIELQRWMMEWDIGVAFEDTYTEARQLLRSHLKQLSPDLEEWVKAVLAEDAQVQEDADKPVRARTRAQLAMMMTDEDWETLARIAANTAANIAFDCVRKASQVTPRITAAA